MLTSQHPHLASDPDCKLLIDRRKQCPIQLVMKCELSGHQGKNGGRQRARNHLQTSAQHEDEEPPAKHMSTEGQKEIIAHSDAAEVRVGPAEKKWKRRRLEKMQA